MLTSYSKRKVASFFEHYQPDYNIITIFYKSIIIII